MNRRILVSTLLLLALLVSVVPAQAQPVARPAAATYNDWAQFISDVTVPDGTNFAANTPFTKIWRLKNIGNSTWTSAFSVVFISGEMMSATSPQYLTTNVIPGQTVDIAVNMVAPANPGAYQGFLGVEERLRRTLRYRPHSQFPVLGQGHSRNGCTHIGCGLRFCHQCRFSKLDQPNQPACLIPVTRSIRTVRWFCCPVRSWRTGPPSRLPDLRHRPNNTSSGFIKGVYPEFYVQPTDRFKATISCPYNAPGCNIYFQLDYQIGTSAVSTFASFREKSDGLYYNADVDLSLLAGKNVKFILTVMNDGAYSTDDKGLWVAPRIERGSTTTPPPPPSTGCTDKVAFIADVTVPDGTVMVPNYSFTKTWRLKNIGTCTWTPSYSVTYVSGDPMSAVYPAH